MRWTQREASLTATDEEEFFFLVVFCALCQFVEDGARDQGIESALGVDATIGEHVFGGFGEIVWCFLLRNFLRRLWKRLWGLGFSLCHKDGMIVVDGCPIVERCFELQGSVGVSALRHEEGSELDGDSTSLCGGDEPMLSVCVFV